MSRNSWILVVVVFLVSTALFLFLLEKSYVPLRDSLPGDTAPQSQQNLQAPAEHTAAPAGFRHIPFVGGFQTEALSGLHQHGILHLADQKKFPSEGFYVPISKQQYETLLMTLTLIRNLNAPLPPEFFSYLTPQITGIFIEDILNRHANCAVRLERIQTPSTCISMYQEAVIVMVLSIRFKMPFIPVFGKEELFRTLVFENDFKKNPSTPVSLERIE